MNRNKSFILGILFVFVSNISSYGLSMNSHVINHFKKVFSHCVNDAIRIKGEFKNNGYYVNLKDGSIKGHSFSNVIVKFEDLTENSRNELLKSNADFNSIQSKCKIKLAGDIVASEFQEIINQEIIRVSSAKRIFNSANFTLDNDAVIVTGSVNLKKVPGNPFAMISNDSFTPFTAKLSANLTDTVITMNIIEGSINGEEMSPELKNVFLNWLNPLWDFSQLGFPCGIKEFKITPSAVRITGFVF
ncbi:MAG: hypothetical protein IKP71_10635 [Candidatus Riflebacteria bacterium]|nr:hypothetical protein [Candidatus Riflebacteria bacterium]